jgi:hypothetical protein
MGLVVAQVVFDGQAPELSRIAEKVTELSGLPLSVKDSGADLKADLYHLHAHLAFACEPKTQLELHSYRAGAVKEFYRRTCGDAPLPMAQYVQGLNEAPGTQTVYLRGYVGQEPTLLFVTQLALEALGGRPRHPLSEELRREYGTPITATQLAARRRKMEKQLLATALVGVVLLPVLIPLWLLGFALALVLMPWRIGKAYKLYRAYTEGGDSSPEQHRAANRPRD